MNFKMAWPIATSKLAILLILSLLSQSFIAPSAMACHATIYPVCTDDYTEIRRFRLCHRDGWRPEDYRVSYLVMSGMSCTVPANPQWSVIRMNKGQCVIVEVPISNGDGPVYILAEVTGLWNPGFPFNGSYRGGIRCGTSSSSNGGFQLIGNCNCGSDSTSCKINSPPSSACHDGTDYYQCGNNCGDSCATFTDF